MRKPCAAIKRAAIELCSWDDIARRGVTLGCSHRVRADEADVHHLPARPQRAGTLRVFTARPA